MDICFDIVHALPGRARIRVPHIKDDETAADQVAQLIQSKPGVTSVRVNCSCASVVVCYDTTVLRTFIPEHQLRGMTIESSGDGVSVHPTRTGSHKLQRLRSHIGRFRGLVLPTAALVLSLAKRAIPIGPVYAIVAAAATPIFHRAALTIRREKRLGVDFLDAACVAIMGAQRNLPTCAFMTWLIGLGEQIRDETARRSEKAIADLLDFEAGTVTVLKDGKRVKLPAGCLAVGDSVVVHAGDTIPVDGAVVRGRAGVDQRSLTGESAVVEVSLGDRVFAGSIAVDGQLVIATEAIGLNTRTGRIVQMLRAAPVRDTKIENYAARFADRLVLPTIALSGAAFAISRSVARALSVLIVDFGTGVRIAAPTAFLSFMAQAAHRNIVIKGGRAIEKLAVVDTVIFDKTGTLTRGLPEVTHVTPTRSGWTAEGIIRLAAAAEEGLNHPVAHALAAAAHGLVPLERCLQSRLHVGFGVKAEIDRRSIIVGSERMMGDEHIDIESAAQFAGVSKREAASVLYVAVDGELIGLINYVDGLRPESVQVIEGLRSLGIRNIVMLTGDREDVARVTANALGITRYVSEAFPEHKLAVLRELQNAGRVVAVVGDGVNDSLALAHADVAVAPLGATDAAKEASDVLLMADDLRLLLEAFTIARLSLGLVKQNYAIVGAPNAAALLLAAVGRLGPAGATFVNNGATVVAGLNGLRPLLGRR